VLEMVERVLAALIIVGMLGIVVFLALDSKSPTDIVDVPPESEVTPSTTIERETIVQPRSNPDRGNLQQVKKIEDRLPRSSTVEMRRYVAPAAPSQRQRHYGSRRDHLTRADYQYVRSQSRALRNDRCLGGLCDCAPCDRPHWTHSGPICWEY